MALPRRGRPGIFSVGKKIMKKLLHHLVDQFSWNLSNHIMNRRYVMACEQARHKLPLLLPRVAATLQAQRSEGGLSHAFSELKLIELAEFLWQFRPRTVLELGGGATTAVLAEYVHFFPEVQVVSVDESAGYQAATRRRISPTLQDNLTYIHCPRREAIDGDGVRVCFYDSVWQKMLPDRSVDFVYVDGPSSDDGSGGKLPCSDVVRLKDEGWQIGNVVFDVRIQSVRYCLASGQFAGYMLHPHRNAMSLATETWVVNKVQHHSWFAPGPLSGMKAE